jgi:hypothetical protein
MLIKNNEESLPAAPELVARYRLLVVVYYFFFTTAARKIGFHIWLIKSTSFCYVLSATLLLAKNSFPFSCTWLQKADLRR